MRSELIRSLPRTRTIQFEVKRWFCWIRAQVAWQKWPNFKAVPSSHWSQGTCEALSWNQSHGFNHLPESLKMFRKIQVWWTGKGKVRKNFSKLTLWLSFVSQPHRPLLGLWIDPSGQFPYVTLPWESVCFSRSYHTYHAKGNPPWSLSICSPSFTRPYILWEGISQCP